jgi:integrase
MTAKTKADPRAPTGRRKAAFKSVPIDQVAGEIDRQLKAEGRSWGTKSRARQVFLMLKEGCGMQTTADLNSSVTAVGRFQTLRPDLLPVSRAAYLRDFQALCHRMVKMGYLSSIPAFPPIPQSRSFPRTTKRAPTPSREEVKRYLDHLGAKAEGDWKVHRTFALASTLAYAGVSRTEAFRLRWSDIDIEGGIISIGTRTGGRQSRFKPRVRIQSELRTILKEWLPECGCEWVFPGVRRRGPWSLGGRGPGNDPIKSLREQGILAGIETPITFEGLRRFYVENFVPTVPGIGPEPAPQPESKTVSPRKGLPEAAASEPVAAVQLGSPDDPAIVFGEQREFKTPGEYKVIKALIDAFPKRLRLQELQARSGVNTARRILETMRNRDPLWRKVITVPGKGYVGSKPMLGILELS